MPRIKLTRRSSYHFKCELAVRVTDINYGGHLGNDSVVALLHQARVELLDSIGLNELDLGDGTTGLIQTDLAIAYQGEAFMLDKLEIQTEFSEVRRSTFRMCHAIARDDTTIALAEIGFAGYNYAKHKMRALPESFKELVATKH